MSILLSSKYSFVTENGFKFALETHPTQPEYADLVLFSLTDQNGAIDECRLGMQKHHLEALRDMVDLMLRSNYGENYEPKKYFKD